MHNLCIGSIHTCFYWARQRVHVPCTRSNLPSQLLSPITSRRFLTGCILKMERMGFVCTSIEVPVLATGEVS